MKIYYIIIIIGYFDSNGAHSKLDCDKSPILLKSKGNGSDTHTGLDLRARRRTKDMLHAKISIDRIAAGIGRLRSILYRGAKRSSFTVGEGVAEWLERARGAA